MSKKINIVILLSIILSSCLSTKKDSNYGNPPSFEDTTTHCFERFLGNGIDYWTDSFAIETKNGGFIIYEAVDSIKYIKKYKTSIEGCTVFIDTCFCSQGSNKGFDLIWENDSVCFFSYSAGTGVSGDLIINKLDCNKSIFGYSLFPNRQGDYLLIDDEDTVVESIW